MRRVRKRPARSQDGGAKLSSKAPVAATSARTLARLGLSRDGGEVRTLHPAVTLRMLDPVDGGTAG